MAGHFGWNLKVLRLVVLVAACSPMFPVVAVLYALAGMILPARSALATEQPPPAPMGSPAGYGQPAATPANVSAGELRYRISEMEDRLRAMEAYVTSAQYEIDRELRTRQ
jgi:phage shock protein PspC (stress-responsive transcriptional regulator)